MAIITKNYTIPLRKRFQLASPFKRTPRAVKAIREYVVKHTKAEDVKLGKHLNELLWQHGIKNPPHKVSVTVALEGGVAKVELEGKAYVEAAKMQEKKEPETFKDKLTSKLGVKEEAPKKEESAAKEEGSSKESPVVEKPAAVPAKEEPQAKASAPVDEQGKAQ